MAAAVGGSRESARAPSAPATPARTGSSGGGGSGGISSSAWRDAINLAAGGFGGVCLTLVGAPFDFVKARMPNLS